MTPPLDCRGDLVGKLVIEANRATPLRQVACESVSAVACAEHGDAWFHLLH
jgi:hypothetical protein